MLNVLINNNMSKFKGFSTIGRVRAPYTLTGSELVKRDLLNEFYTRKGERLMRPKFGSIIWDVLMNPSTSELENQVREDVLRIIDRDPRVQHLKTTVYLLDHTLRVEIDLRFLPMDNVDQLYLEYNRNIIEGVE